VKRNIYIIIPLLLSLALPGIGSIVYVSEVNNSYPFIYKWIATSTFLFFLWQVLVFSWKIKSIIRRTIYLIVGILLYVVLLTFISETIGFRENDALDVKEIVRIIFLISIFLTIQYGLNSQKKIETLKTEKEKLLKENYMAQLQSLRSQMDPHFLFNSLNTLRSMVNKNHKNSEEFILNLSNIYRSTLQHKNNNTLPLNEELSFLNSYLQLMKCRNDKAIKFSLPNSDSDYSNYSLPSFGLQSVVENCFKHNSMSSKRPLNIQITLTDNNYIQVANNIQEKLTENEGSKLGLDLLERRYKLLGYEKGVVVEKGKENFVVKLKLIPSS
jgi:LytS/YehU family sensor histidine kinase